MNEQSPPPLRHALGETRIVTEWIAARASEGQVARQYPGDGRPIMVLPGMWISDLQTRMLRRVLAKAGYAVKGWGLGFNWPGRHDLLDKVTRRISALCRSSGQPVTLIGWSLGGLYAREAAKQIPTDVEAVITLGSPFSGNPRSNRAWRMYEWSARQRVEDSPLFGKLSVKPCVPTIAIWSLQDSVIPPDAARGLDHERDEAVQVTGGHFAMASSRNTLMAVLRILSQLRDPTSKL